MHRLAWYTPGQDEQELRESLILALLDSGETVMLQDCSSNYIFIANLPDIWGVPAGCEPNDENLFGSELAHRLSELRRGLTVSGASGMLEVAAGEDRIFQFSAYTTLTRGEQLVVKTTIREVTAERRREQLLRSLLREVSHRSKNLMAIIQSLASQTARFTLSKDEFLRKFRGRLHALSQAQDLITDSDWRGASVFDLLRQQANLYLPEYPHLVRMHGENVLLNPNGAVYVGLAFHELVVNTISHGGNLASHLPVTLHCSRIQSDTGDQLELLWEEPLSNRPADSKPAEPNPGEAKSKGQKQNANFGSVVLEKVVPAALAGQAAYDIETSHIRYRLTFPI